MIKRFSVVFLKPARDFIIGLDKKTQTKIYYIVDKASFINDPKLFKKLQDEIWEFRIKYKTLHIRLLAFWEKRDDKNTLVISTHGFIKKTDKVPKNEIDKAINDMNRYLKNNKNKRDEK